MANNSIVQFLQVLFLTCWTLYVIENSKHESQPVALTASEISTVSKSVIQKESNDLDVESQSQNTTHVHFIIDNITTYRDGGSDSASGDTFPRDDVSEYSTYSNNQNVTCSRIFIAYLTKCTGIKGTKSPIRSPILEILISSLLSFIGILVISTTSFRLLSDNKTGAYAATGVLLYDAYQLPISQPRNVVGSYALCSLLGVCVRLLSNLLGLNDWLSGAVAVTLSVLTMNLTGTNHPSGAVCALTAVIGGPSVVDLGFGFVAISTGAALLMVVLAVIGNNLVPSRQYPQYWW